VGCLSYPDSGSAGGDSSSCSAVHLHSPSLVQGCAAAQCPINVAAAFTSALLQVCNFNAVWVSQCGGLPPNFPQMESLHVCLDLHCFPKFCILTDSFTELMHSCHLSQNAFLTSFSFICCSLVMVRSFVLSFTFVSLTQSYLNSGTKKNNSS